jgi:lactoylglutathione lyase
LEDTDEDNILGCMKLKLTHTMIRVKDLEATLEFYIGFLGLKETRRHPIGDEATLVFLSDEAGTHEIELTYNHDGRDYDLGNQFGHLAFLVDDLPAVQAEVEKRGWWSRASKPEAGTKYIFVHDPNGYDIEILQARTS